MKRFVAWIVGAPVVLAVVLLSVANRAPVAFSLDPFSLDEPTVAFEVPLFVLLFAAVFLGLTVGWFVGLGSALQRHRKERYGDGATNAARASPGQSLLPRV